MPEIQKVTPIKPEDYKVVENPKYLKPWDKIYDISSNGEEIYTVAAQRPDDKIALINSETGRKEVVSLSALQNLMFQKIIVCKTPRNALDGLTEEIEEQINETLRLSGVKVNEAILNPTTDFNVSVGDILIDELGNEWAVGNVDTTYGHDKYGNPADYISLKHVINGKVLEGRGGLGMPSTGLKYIFVKHIPSNKRK